MQKTEKFLSKDGDKMSSDMLRQWNSRWNSFNPAKALVHLPYWREAWYKGEIAPPVFVSVDPCGACNLRCSHCNAAETLRHTHDIMNDKMMEDVCELMLYWKT
jgi:sulfatase maturation enzyme AslB (radical SAM superfamily)